MRGTLQAHFLLSLDSGTSKGYGAVLYYQYLRERERGLLNFYLPLLLFL